MVNFRITDFARKSSKSSIMHIDGILYQNNWVYLHHVLFNTSQRHVYIVYTSCLWLNFCKMLPLPLQKLYRNNRYFCILSNKRHENLAAWLTKWTFAINILKKSNYAFCEVRLKIIGKLVILGIQIYTINALNHH